MGRVAGAQRQAGGVLRASALGPHPGRSRGLSLPMKGRELYSWNQQTRPDGRPAFQGFVGLAGLV